MRDFKKNKNFLLISFTINFLIFGSMSFFLLQFRSLNFFLELSVMGLPLILLGLVSGLVSATAFHNASHGNIKPRFLNWIVGEFTASFSLEDMRCFRIGHLLHHMHSDDPELDPHPPSGLSFWRFIAKSRQKTITCISNYYYKHHGKGKRASHNVKAQILTFHLAAAMKLLFWYLLFGPFFFVYFYIPTYLAYFFGFAHLNYISHLEEGGEKIHNHDHNLFYKVMNVLTSGGYYHKNHHRYPKLYNPSRAERV